MKKALGPGVLCVIIGLVLFAFVAGDCFNMVFRKVDMEDKNFGAYESGEICDGEIKYIIADLGSYEDSRRLFGIPFSKVDTRLYLISGNGGYLTVEARSDLDAFDQLCTSTRSYLNQTEKQAGNSIRFLSKARELNDDQLAMIKAHFDAQGVNPGDWEMVMSSMVLAELDLTLLVVQVSVSFGLILIGVVLLLLARRSRYGETVFVGEMTPEEEAHQAEYLSGKADHIRAKAAEDAEKKAKKKKQR